MPPPQPAQRLLSRRKSEATSAYTSGTRRSENASSARHVNFTAASRYTAASRSGRSGRHSAGATTTAGGGASRGKKKGDRLADADQGQLLEYYRKRVDEFERERDDALARQPSFEADRRLRGEVASLHREVRDLQKAVGDAHIFLYEEREQVVLLSAENERLKLREKEDRKKIQHLLAMTRPVDHETTYFPDGRGGSDDGKNSGDACPIHGEAGDEVALDLVDEIYTRTEDPAVLYRVIDSLRTQLAEQSRLSRDRYAALMEDRRVRAEEARAREVDCDRRLAEAEADRLEVQRQLQLTTRDYLDLRHRHLTEERGWHERLTAAALECKRSEERADRADRAARELSQRTRHKVSREQSEELDRVRAQAMQREHDVAMLREQYAATQKLYEGRIAHLQERLDDATARYNDAARRRRLDHEGFTNDVRALRQQAGDLEHLLMHLHLDRGGAAGRAAAAAPAQAGQPASEEARLAAYLDGLRQHMRRLEDALSED